MTDPCPYCGDTNLIQMAAVRRHPSGPWVAWRDAPVMPCPQHQENPDDTN